MMASRRFEELDFVKAICIFLVVFCHHQVIPEDSFAGNLLMLLAWGAVPCFFLCSGYVMLCREEPPEKTLRRVLKIYGTLVIWKVLYLIFYAALREVELGTVLVIRYLFLFESLPGVNTGHFWFMNAYLMALLLLPVLTPLFAKGNLRTMVWVTALCFGANQLICSGELLIQVLADRFGVTAFPLSGLETALPFTGGCSYVLGYFLLGGVLRQLREQGRQEPLWMGLAALAVGLAGLLWIKHYQTGSWLWAGKFLSGGYHFTSTALMSWGMFSLLMRVRGRAARRLGTWVGRNTMGIFYLHLPLLFLLSRFVYPLLPVSLWVGIAKTLLVVAAATGLTLLGKRVPVLKTLLS